jgi:hypothetical protein
MLIYIPEIAWKDMTPLAKEGLLKSGRNEVIHSLPKVTL